MEWYYPVSWTDSRIKPWKCDYYKFKAEGKAASPLLCSQGSSFPNLSQPWKQVTVEEEAAAYQRLWWALDSDHTFPDSLFWHYFNPPLHPKICTMFICDLGHEKFCLGCPFLKLIWAVQSASLLLTLESQFIHSIRHGSPLWARPTLWSAWGTRDHLYARRQAQLY